MPSEPIKKVAKDKSTKTADRLNAEQSQPSDDQPSNENTGHLAQNATAPNNDLPASPPPETGGQAGLEPTRYGDWEKKGRCTDF